MAVTATEIATSARANEFLSQPRQMLIDGQWVDSASGKTFPVYDPSTGETIADVAEGDAEDINRAVAAARRAFDEGPWSSMTPNLRSKLMWKLSYLIEENGAISSTLE